MTNLISPFDLDLEELRCYGLPHITDVKPMVYADIFVPILVNLKSSYKGNFSLEMLTSTSIKNAICYYLSLRYQIAIDRRFIPSVGYSTKDYFLSIFESIINLVDINLLNSHINKVKQSRAFNFYDINMDIKSIDDKQIESLAISVTNRYCQINRELDELYQLLSNLAFLDLKLNSNELLSSIILWIGNFDRMLVSNRFSESKVLSLLKEINGLTSPTTPLDDDCHFVKQSSVEYITRYHTQDLSDCLGNILSYLDHKTKYFEQGIISNPKVEDTYMERVMQLKEFGVLKQSNSHSEREEYQLLPAVGEYTFNPVNHNLGKTTNIITRILGDEFDYTDEWLDIMEDLNDVVNYFSYYFDEYTFEVMNDCVNMTITNINKYQNVSISFN